MTQARWPSSVAAASLGLVARRPPRSRRGRRRSASGSAHASAFWTSGSASPISSAEERQGVAGDVRLAAAPAVDVGHRRDGRADEPALPARRAVDELLELGPAVGLGGDPLAVRVGERVDGDPVAGLAGGAAQRAARSAPARPRASARAGRRRTSGPRASARGRGDRRRTAAASCGRRRVALAEAALDGGEQRPADAVDGADPGRDALLARRGTPGRRASRGPRQGARRRRPGRWSAPRGCVPSASAAGSVLRRRTRRRAAVTGLGRARRDHGASCPRSGVIDRPSGSADSRSAP